MRQSKYMRAGLSYTPKHTRNHVDARAARGVPCEERKREYKAESAHTLTTHTPCGAFGGPFWALAFEGSRLLCAARGRKSE